MIKKGTVIVNFELVKPVKSIDDLLMELKDKPSIFWKFKVMPTSFFYSWQLRQIEHNVNSGFFWKVKILKDAV